MLARLIDILKADKKISEWKINQTKTDSTELFFIKRSLDMNRSKSVVHTVVTVYVDFEEKNEIYRGSSSAEIHPSMEDSEIKKVVQRLTFTASLIKNKFYPITDDSSSAASSGKILNTEEFLPDLIKSIYKEDNRDKGGINSAELFLENVTTRIINSKGIDVSYSSFRGTLEFIVSWKGASEEIELYRNINFSEFNPDFISEEIKYMLDKAESKADASFTPEVKNLPVLLCGSPVKELFSYYYEQASAQNVYSKLSVLTLGTSVQGESIIGDRLNMSLDPSMAGSIYSSAFDEDGTPLHKVELYKDGVLTNYWGNRRFSHYLNIPVTGNIKNIDIAPGSFDIASLKGKNFIELHAFSDFQMDIMTGNFAGEIRLGYYHKDGNIIPITGGSLSGNIKKVHQNMLLSKDIQQDNEFRGPKIVLMHNVSIAGCETE